MNGSPLCRASPRIADVRHRWCQVNQVEQYPCELPLLHPNP